MRGFAWNEEFADKVDAYGQLVKEGKAPTPTPFGVRRCTKYPSAPSVRKDINPNYVPPKSVNNTNNGINFEEILINEIRVSNILKILDNSRILSVCTDDEINYLIEYVRNYAEIISNSKSTDFVKTRKFK